MEEKKKRTNQKTKTAGNGEGSLYFSEVQSKWIFQYTHNGKRKTIKQKNNEKTKDFKARVTALKNSLNNGTYIEKSKDTIYNIIRKYINQKLNDGISGQSTYRRDMDSLKSVEISCRNFVHKPIQNVVLQDIQDAKEIMKERYSQSVIDKIWQFLKKAFSIASSPSNRLIPYNIMEDENLIKPISNKQTKKILPLTDTERERLLNVLDNNERNHPYRNIVKLTWLTGMRVGEVLARSSSDITKDGLYIHNTLTEDGKGNKILGKHTKTYNKSTGIDDGARYFPIFPEIQEILNEQLSSKLKNIHDLLFWDYKNNNFISDVEINSWLRRINKKYHISSKNLHNHRLRHDRITQWYESGMSIEAIQYLAGHVEGSAITQGTYIDVSKDYAFKELKKIKSGMQ